MERAPARSAAIDDSEAENEKKKTSVEMVVGVEDGERNREATAECVDGQRVVECSRYVARRTSSCVRL